MKVKDLYVSEANWCRLHFAKNAIGACCYDDPTANCWCLLGAVQRCYYNRPDGVFHNKLFFDIMDKIKKHLGGLDTITDWNDDKNRTFDEVKKLVVELDI